MPFLRRVLVLAFITGLLVLTPARAHAEKKRCDQRCERQEVTWYWASMQTKWRMWLGAVIAATPQAQCVARVESHGLYYVENAQSTASGKYEFLDSTWRSVAIARGRPDLPARAKDAAWYEQEASFWWAWVTYGGSPWGPDGCR